MALRKRSFIVLGFGAMALTAACGGKIVDIGGQSTTQTLTPSTVSVASSQCADGYAHTNICCTGGDSTSSGSSESTCEAWPDDPFHPCPDGWNTYPNAAQCCSLDNPADCTSCGGAGGDDAGGSNTAGQAGTKGGTDICDPPTAYTAPEDGGPTLIDGGVGDVTACDPRCPPGYTGISPYAPEGCCISNPDGTSACFGEARADRDAGPTTDASPTYPDDAGPYDGGVYDAGAYDGGVIDAGAYDDGGYSGGGGSEVDNICDLECPPGWFLADAAGGVCCNNDTSGNEECFAIPFPDDNGGAGGTDVTPPSTGSGGVNPGGPEIDASAGR